MIERLVVAAALGAAACLFAACADPAASPDAGGGGVEVDAPRNTDFRDAADCGGGGSGSGSSSGSGSGSGAGCGSGSGSGAPVDAPPCDLVTFRLDDAAATSVWVSGSFTAWATMPPGARALVNDGAGHWSLTTQIGAGRQLYKLVIDGTRWVRDPGNPVTEPDGFGGVNSVVVTCAAMPPG